MRLHILERFVDSFFTSSVASHLGNRQRVVIHRAFDVLVDTKFTGKLHGSALRIHTLSQSLHTLFTEDTINASVPDNLVYVSALHVFNRLVVATNDINIAVRRHESAY